MKNLKQIMQKYILKNEKPTYYRIKKDLTVEVLEPSYIFELIYFGEQELAEKNQKDCVVKKYKKIKRLTKLDTDTIYDRLFRSLVNTDKYHSLQLANELMIRDPKTLLQLLYDLSYISCDENKLIKTYLFECISNEIGYEEFLLRNLIGYFTYSYPGYVGAEQKKLFLKNASALYVLIYTKKFGKLDILGNDNMSIEKKSIYKNLMK